MTLRVAYLLQDQPSIYGAERASLDLLQSCLNHPEVDPEVFLIHETRLGPDAGNFGQALAATGAPVHSLPVSSAFSRDLLNQIGSLGGDVDLIHAVGPKADLHLALAKTSAKKVSTLHGWLFRKECKERLHEWLDAWSLKRMDRVIALSRFYLEILQRKKIRATRIPTGFDVDSVRCESRSSGRRVAILGRLSSEKNHSQLFNALALSPDVELIVAGEGPEEAALKTLAEELGISDRVEFAGFVPREKVLARTDALVLCSIVENLPYTLMEAMALRIPVIATNTGGMPDLIEPGRTGWLVPVGDEQALAQAISEALSDSGAQVEAAREKLETEFSPQHSVDEHVKLYQELCDV